MIGRCQRRGHASSGPTIATSEITASVAKLIPSTSRASDPTTRRDRQGSTAATRWWREPSGSTATVGRHRREFLDITCPRRDRRQQLPVTLTVLFRARVRAGHGVAVGLTAGWLLV
jgi:hypothetical protein